MLADARPDMDVCREATFAPVMAVLPFDTLEEALAMEARCPFALGASVFTRDLALAGRLASGLRAGTVSVPHGRGTDRAVGPQVIRTRQPLRRALS